MLRRHGGGDTRGLRGVLTGAHSSKVHRGFTFSTSRDLHVVLRVYDTEDNEGKGGTVGRDGWRADE